MTGRNKLIGGALALVTAAQFCHGGFSIVWMALRPGKSQLFLSHACVLTHQPLAEWFPEIDLDAFKFCAYQRWRLGKLLYCNLTMCFGMYPPDPGVPARLTPLLPTSQTFLRS